MHLCNFVLLFAISLLFINTEALRIGAFNIQTFGTSKFGDTTVMGYILKILRRYDVVLIQELRDSSLVVIPGLLEKLKSGGEKWDVKYSESLGRSTYKEQYAYYFRTDKVTVGSPYQYDDGTDDGTDAFSREPFGVLVESKTTGDLTKFGMLGCHIAPDAAVAEIDALVDVFTAAKKEWSTENVIIMGDLNADCSYVNSQEKANLALRKDTSYLWLIGDDVDTTVSATDCAYDRVIVSGAQLKKSIDKDSAIEYRYDKVYNLTTEMAKDISDHYPVEFVIPEDDDNEATCIKGLSFLHLGVVLLTSYFI